MEACTEEVSSSAQLSSAQLSWTDQVVGEQITTKEGEESLTEFHMYVGSTIVRFLIDINNGIRQLKTDMRIALSISLLISLQRAS